MQLKCGKLSDLEKQSLTIFFGKTVDQSLASDKQAIMPVLEKLYVLNSCTAKSQYEISTAALERYIEASREYQDNHTAASSMPMPDDIDASGLSAEQMVKNGENATNAKNFAAARRWYMKAAAMGNAKAMLKISYLYEGGRGVVKDEGEAIRWRTKAAESGDLEAITQLGFDYERGSGVAQNYAEAMGWYRKAADRGDAGAMRSAGRLYHYGDGVPQDYGEAMRWHRKAADLGDTLAMYSRGIAYENGNGVRADQAEARAWMKKAAGLGDYSANMWLADHP